MEILGQIGEILARLHGNVAANTESKPAPTKKNVGGRREPEAIGEFEIVDELPIGVRHMGGSARAQLLELTQLIEVALSTPSTDDDGDDAWTPSDLDEVTQDEEEDEQTSGARTKSGGERNTEGNLSPNLVEAVLKLARKYREPMRKLAVQAPQNAIVLFEGVVHLLLTTAAISRELRDKLLPELVSWLCIAWAEAQWPERTRGWMLSVESPEESNTECVSPDPVAALVAVCRWLHWIDLDIEEGTAAHHGMDQARSVLQGLEAYITAHPDSGDLTAPELDQYTETLFLLRSHVSRAEQAQALLAPVWKLEKLGRAIKRCSTHLTEIQSELREIERILESFSHRSTSYKEAAARKEVLGERHGKLTKRLAKLDRKNKQAIHAASTSTHAGAHELYERWKHL
ncbi:hypothetical protein G6O69_36925 [Pseudenhygromyxa sp. WMMC2535]|uniref:hypothetical protein n=1 Tax=Pseudenhygromyxa sp. WMMC2535 TaxID=2712867 RepID=UPI00155602C2|nr:hypothetical protein [Pseudenhygromyxa sp. WMMC2535]NVB37266.1 hypothetical protein [Pseudenhygromyxa sp. WMMC2535]NVB43465.1 hypothetical protein [Pseudenhygromyxa sp. WMMC2535]